MPSGAAKRRKAAKKKMKNGDVHSSNHHHHSSNSSSTHSQGSDDPKSFDDRESDSGDVEREEEEKGEAGGEGEAVDCEAGGCENGKGLSEEIVEIAREAIDGVLGEAKLEDNGSLDVDCSAVDMAKETPIGVLTAEDSAPSNGDVEDKDVAIEEEESVPAELGELKEQDVPSVLESIPGKELFKPVDFIPEEANGVEGASVELVKDVICLPQEINAGFGSSITSDVVESELMKNAEIALQLSDEKENFSSVIDDLQPEKIETKVTSMDEDKPLAGPPVDAISGEDTANVLEIVKQVEEQVVAPAVMAIQMLESVKNEETLEQSDDQVGSTVVTTSCEVDNVKEMETQKRSMVESVQNWETFKQSNDHVGSTVVTTSSKVDNVKEMETQKRSMDQSLIGSNPLPVRRTTWTGCCGLFELFSGANR